MLNQGCLQYEIANVLGKNKSVISRELSRNCDRRSGEYKYDLAQRKCDNRHRLKPKAARFTEAIGNRIQNLLEEKYSPEQIVGLSIKEGFDIVSHERIYQHIWQDKKQKGDLYIHLRNQGKRYRKRGNTKDNRGIIKDRISIENRPDIVDEKERFGDLEIDTIIGKNHKGAIVTINDRATGLLRMKKVKSKKAELVKKACLELLLDLKPYIHTITADNGKEFAYHKEISQALEIDFYFARPYHSWERGANENLNGLIRQYIPKNTDFSTISNRKIAKIQEDLNNRPRKRFNFESPNTIFNQKVAFIT